MTSSSEDRSHRRPRLLPAFVLLVLADGPLYGNAIRAALLEELDDFKVDVGAIYRTLQMLESDGQVLSHWDTDSRGPARKVYELTEAGWKRLAFWEADVQERRRFLDAFISKLERTRKIRAQARRKSK